MARESPGDVEFLQNTRDIAVEVRRGRALRKGATTQQQSDKTHRSCSSKTSSYHTGTSFAGRGYTAHDIRTDQCRKTKRTHSRAKSREDNSGEHRPHPFTAHECSCPRPTINTG